MIARDRLTSGGTSGTVTDSGDPVEDDDDESSTTVYQPDVTQTSSSGWNRDGGSGTSGDTTGDGITTNEPATNDDLEQDQETSQQLGGTGAVTDPYAEDDSELYREDNTDDIIDSGDPVEEDDAPIETGIFGSGRDPGTQTTVDEDGQSDGFDGSEISGDPHDDSDGSTEWGFGPDSPGTEPDYDGDGEPGGNLTDNPVFNPDINVEAPEMPTPEFEFPDLSSMVSREMLLIATAAIGSVIVVLLVAAVKYIKTVTPGL